MSAVDAGGGAAGEVEVGDVLIETIMTVMVDDESGYPKLESQILSPRP